jgi:hypothetical protein
LALRPGLDIADLQAVVYFGEEWPPARALVMVHRALIVVFLDVARRTRWWRG